MIENVRFGALYISPIYPSENAVKPARLDLIDCEVESYDCDHYANKDSISAYIELDANDIPEYVKGIHCPMSVDEEANFECDIDATMLKKLTGVDLAHGSDIASYTVLFHQPVRVQVRRHKKKRINKKWAKRYGYKTIFKSYKFEDAYIEPHENGCDILGRNFVHI